MSSLHDHLSSDQLLYGSVWEDEELLCRSLGITPQDDVLSICSAGCNVLALVAAGARSVTAVDLNLTELALLELKLAAIVRLTVEELARLVGESPGDDRLELYGRVRDALSVSTRAHWDARTEMIGSGIVASGRLERYFGAFASQRLPHIWDSELAHDLVSAKDPATRRALLSERGNLNTLRKAVQQHFSAEAMARDGRSLAQLAHVGEVDIGEAVYRRFLHFIGSCPWEQNHYLERFLTGRLQNPHRQGPAYLRPEVYARLRERVDRVRLVHADIGSVLRDAGPGAFSKANLSDLFEYLDTHTADVLFAQLAEGLRPGGRFAYWNLLVPRAARHERLATLHSGVAEDDRLFFYGAFMVHEVLA
jgi:S-adenosylmethionine-diacylglycerol 3-amino-3-carboxypropyl transferase